MKKLNNNLLYFFFIPSIRTHSNEFGRTPEQTPSIVNSLGYSCKVFFILALFFFFPLFSQESSDPSGIKSPIPSNMATGLKATVINDGFSVQLEWTPPEDPGDVIIARSDSIIDTQEKLFVADSLGIYPSNPQGKMVKDYRDINLKPGTYFYAVAMVTAVRKKSVDLVPDQNFTVIPVQISENGVIKTPIHKMVKSIDVKKIGNYTRIHWDPPDDPNVSSYTYNIYKSKQKLDSINHLRNAEKLMELDHPENSYVDKVENSEDVFYGVSISDKDTEYLPLQENVSFLELKRGEKSVDSRDLTPVTKPEENTGKIEINNNINIDNERGSKESEVKEIPAVQSTKSEKSGIYIKNMNYELKEEGLLFSWEPPVSIDPSNIKYFIYRSTSPLESLDIALEKSAAQKIGEVEHPTTTFFLPKSERKKILYFGVTVKQIDGREDTDLEENSSYVKVFPVGMEKYVADPGSEIRKQENPKENPKENPEKVEFKVIMTDYYKKGKYQEALKKFQNYADSQKEIPEKAKALFYVALCDFHLKDYDKALKILLDKLVQDNFDKDRVDFYVDQCLEKRSNE